MLRRLQLMLELLHAAAGPLRLPVSPKRLAVEAPVHLPAPKKVVRRDRAAKRPASEALSAVRRFGDNLRDIPVSAYGADGTRRTIVIRPTSIQDVYYYSAPR